VEKVAMSHDGVLRRGVCKVKLGDVGVAVVQSQRTEKRHGNGRTSIERENCTPWTTALSLHRLAMLFTGYYACYQWEKSQNPVVDMHRRCLIAIFWQYVLMIHFCGCVILRNRHCQTDRCSLRLCSNSKRHKCFLQSDVMVDREAKWATFESSAPSCPFRAHAAACPFRAFVCSRLSA
jgi:hypothetical protein